MTNLTPPYIKIWGADKRYKTDNNKVYLKNFQNSLQDFRRSQKERKGKERKGKVNWRNEMRLHLRKKKEGSFYESTSIKSIRAAMISRFLQSTLHNKSFSIIDE